MTIIIPAQCFAEAFCKQRRVGARGEGQQGRGWGCSAAPVSQGARIKDSVQGNFAIKARDVSP